jgi:LysM repeat protein
MGTDPLVADSDGDGLLDGEDPNPLQTSTPTPVPSATPLPPTETATPQTAVPHTVQSGETLETIAGQYDVSVAQIAELNDLSLQDRLQAGQQVFVPLNPGFIIPELVIKIPAVNLRSGPGIEYTIIAYPERGTFATILGQTIDPTWYLVELQDSRGTRGWLSAVVVRLLYPTRPETIPLVATVPPTPVQ